MANVDGDITLKIGVVADEAQKVAKDLHKQMERTLNKPIDTKAFDGIKKSIKDTAAESEKLGEELRTLKDMKAGTNPVYKQILDDMEKATIKSRQLKTEMEALRKAGRTDEAEAVKQQREAIIKERRALQSKQFTMMNKGQATVLENGVDSKEYAQKVQQLMEANNQLKLYIKQLERMRAIETQRQERIRFVESTRRQAAYAKQEPTTNVAGVKRGLSETEDRARVLTDTITKLRNRVADVDKSVHFLTLDKSIQKTIDDTAKLQARLEQMRAEVYKSTPTQAFTEASAKVTELQQKTEKYHAKLMELEEMGKTNTQPYTDTLFKYNQAQNALIAQLQSVRQLQLSGEDYNRVLWTETQEYADIISKQQQLNRDLEIGKQKLKETAEYQAYREQAIPTSKNIAEEATQATEATEALRELEQQKNRTTTANETLGEESEETAVHMTNEKSASDTLRNTLSILVKILHGVDKGLRVIGKGLFTAAKATASFVSHLRGANKESANTSQSFKSLLKFALKYFLGLRSIFILYKRIRSAGIEAYKGLASQFPELKAEVDDLKTSFFQLKNSLATMAQPLLSYLVPAIKTVMNWLISLMNTLANFFAILTGQKYIYKATKNNNALAESMKGAGKAAKEANEDIAEYDNLILIQQDNDNGGGGAGGAADQYAGAWEKVEAESDFAQKLKDAINRGDWEGVGALYADKLNNVVAKVDNWIVGKFYPKAKEWAKRLGRIMNGFTDTFNAKALGVAFADAINSAADIANTFFTTANFEKLGKRVGEFIAKAVKKLDIRLIATALANRLNIAIDFVSGLLGEINFNDIGKKLADGIVTFFNKVEWKKLGFNINRLVTGVFDGISTFLQSSDAGHLLANTVKEFMSGVQWKSIFNSMKNLAKSLMTAFFDFVTSVNWNEILTTISSNITDMVNGFISFVAKAIAVAPWDEIADAIASLIENIDWTQALTSAADLAGKLVNIAIKIIKALATALLKVDWYDVADAIANAIANINWGEVLATLGIAALALIKALGQAILGLVTNPDALLTVGVAIATFFGAKAIWAKVAGVVGPAIAGIFGSGAAASAATAGGSTIGAAAGGGILSGIKTKLTSTAWGNAVLGALTYEFTGKLAGSIAQVIAEAVGDSKLADEYGKFAAKPIAYTAEAIVSQAKAAFSTSTTTGYNELGTALVDWWTGGEYVSRELQKRLDEVNATVEANFQKQLDMLENRLKQGKEISESSMELLRQYRNYDSLVTESLVTNSNHYVDIAKQNAGITETTYSNLITTSQHYVDIAKKNSQEVVNTTAQAEETSNHYVEIAKKNSGYYDKIQKEMEESSNHYVEIAKKNAEAVVKSTEDSTTKMEYAISTVPDFYDSTFGQAATNVTNAFSGMNDFFSQTAEGVKKPFSTMATFFHDTFSQSWNGVVDVFSTRTPEFKSIQDSISGSFKTMINGMITGVNNTITNPFTTLKNLISKMKDLTVGDSKVFASLPTINVPKIPKLAKGAVLPANSPFLAVVGDQTQGTNIETPLDTMVEAFRIALSEQSGGNNQPIVLNLNGKQIAQVVWDEENKRYKQTGQRYRYS